MVDKVSPFTWNCLDRFLCTYKSLEIFTNVCQLARHFLTKFDTKLPPFQARKHTKHKTTLTSLSQYGHQ